MKTLHVYSNRHIRAQVKTIRTDDWVYLENRLSRKRWSMYFRTNGIDESALDINYITHQEFFDLNNVQFDAIVGNPPYSLAGNKTGKKGRAPNLYPAFYKMATAMADTVIMIVPNTSRQHTIFNSFIRENTNKIMPVDDGTFDVNISTWCLIKDNSETNVEHIDWADLKELPEQKVKWAKGKVNVTTEKHLLTDTPGPYTVYHKINGKGLTQSTTSENISALKFFPQDGYAVIMPQQIQRDGWTNTEIVICDGTAVATNGVNLAFVDTHEEAKYLTEYMKTPEFVSQALGACGGMNNMTLGAMKSIRMDNYDY